MQNRLCYSPTGAGMFLLLHSDLLAAPEYTGISDLSEAYPPDNKAMLGTAKIKLIPSETALAEIDLGSAGMTDVCSIMTVVNCEGKCMLNDRGNGIPVGQTTITPSVQAPTGVSM